MPQLHYYGDRVRSLLVAISIIMVVSMPFFSHLIPKPGFFSILAALVLVILGGMVSPKHKAVVIISTIVSGLAFLAFQYHAINAAKEQGFISLFFLVSELLAVLSLIATYFGTKSVRGINLAEGL